MADGFLGRWSRRKLDVKEGKPLEDPVPPASDALSGKEISVEGKTGAVGAAAPIQGRTPGPGAVDAGLRRDGGVPVGHRAEGEGPAAERPVLPTLEDVKTLTHHGDFKPYMAQGVAPEVKNAAMKKLFADPHFNVMDRLDTYIDDYSLPDPIPASMLRQMVGSKLLGLFDEEDRKEALAQAGAGDVADAPVDQSVAQSYANPDIPGHDTHDTVTDTASPRAALPDAPASQEHDAHTDLRLQPDDAAPAQSAGRGPQ